MSARIKLSEVISALSCALDLADGQPAGHAMRSCLIGMRVAHELGLGAEDRSALYYATLLKGAGCSSTAARIAQLADDRGVGIPARGAHESLASRASRLVGITRAASTLQEIAALRGERGAEIVIRLGLPVAAAEAVRHLDEQWNGTGLPEGLSGPSIPLMSRIINLAQTVEVLSRERGTRAALRTVRQRRGSWFDADLVDVVCRWREETSWWDRLGCGDMATEVAGVEPESHVKWITSSDIDVIARAFADIIDAKSPYMFSHSRRVAAYGLAIAREMGVDSVGQRRVYRAALLHDIGNLSVPNRILDRPARLDAGDRTLVERHPFLTWEILSHIPAFRDFAWPASLHHERLDGTGYPWHLSGRRLDITARIVCVADVYEALTADRPYRPAMSWDEASRILWTGRGKSFDPAVLNALSACHASRADVAELAKESVAAA
jgi:HD-GYP domain-containing protein (c-di-GMP phosphodiesterase class II)